MLFPEHPQVGIDRAALQLDLQAAVGGRHTRGPGADDIGRELAARFERGSGEGQVRAERPTDAVVVAGQPRQHRQR